MKYLLIIIFLFNFSFIAESNTEIDINQNPDINLTYTYINDLKIIWSNIYQKKLKIKNKELDYLLIIEKYAETINNEELFYTLGVVYMNIPNSLKAFKWMNLAANTNDPNALHNIGWWYDHGFGHIKEDNDKALEYYNKAFWELGLGRSGGRLSEIYLSGDGVAKNEVKAREILEKILHQSENLILEDQDILIAEYKLGKMYRYSIGTEQDLKKAVGYFIAASIKGHNEAMVEAGKIYRNWYRESGDEKDNEMAESLYLKAVEQENTEAMIFLSNIYHEKFGKGIDVDTNEVKYISWVYAAYKIGIKNEELKSPIISFLETKILNNEKLVKILDARLEVCINRKFIDCY
jgi:TPR repeat protein